VDLGVIKDEPIGSPSVPSSPLSDSLSLLANNSGSGSKGPYSCEQCGLTFTRRDELEKHETTHPTPNQVNLLIDNRQSFYRLFYLPSYHDLYFLPAKYLQTMFFHTSEITT